MSNIKPQLQLHSILTHHPQLRNFNNPCTIKSFIMNTYTPSIALQNATHRINNPPVVFNKNNEPVHTKFEHHTGTWACTKLKEIFYEDKWAITPEQKDQFTRKKPDLVVEEALEGHTMKLHMAMELKKVGQRIEEALVQLGESLLETLDQKGNTYENQFEIFAVVQAGTDIGFFEYHADLSNLEENDIPNFRGFVSLTQDYPIDGTMTSVPFDKPSDLENLFYNFKHLRLDTEIRKDARNYEIPCIFNIEKHQQEVHFLFQYMEKNTARSSW